jgi:hypothetical protein
MRPRESPELEKRAHEKQVEEALPEFKRRQNHETAWLDAMANSPSMAVREAAGVHTFGKCGHVADRAPRPANPAEVGLRSREEGQHQR